MTPTPILIAFGWSADHAKFMSQAIANCQEGKTPMVVIHQTGHEHGGDLVCLRMSDWIEWFGKL